MQIYKPYKDISKEIRDLKNLKFFLSLLIYSEGYFFFSLRYLVYLRKVPGLIFIGTQKTDSQNQCC